jgi:hypothetical protein
MSLTGKIVNYEDSPFFNVGTLYLKSKGNFTIVPCESKNTKKAFNAIFGTTDIKALAGQNIQYNIDDGLLSWVGLE